MCHVSYAQQTRKSGTDCFGHGVLTLLPRKHIRTSFLSFLLSPVSWDCVGWSEVGGPTDAGIRCSYTVLEEGVCDARAFKGPRILQGRALKRGPLAACPARPQFLILGITMNWTSCAHLAIGRTEPTPTEQIGGQRCGYNTYAKGRARP